MVDSVIIDRRPNPQGKSLPNRRLFLDRARGDLREALKKPLQSRKISETGGESVTIPAKRVWEPVFHHNRRTGRTHHVVPGNKDFVPGDEIDRPTSGEGGGGREGSPDGSGEDSFQFALTRKEILDIMFEDLELPNLVKKSDKNTTAHDLQRAGYTVTGSPSNLSVPRTMRLSMARRIALRRPKPEEVEELERQAKEALRCGDEEETARLTFEIERLSRRMNAIPYVDPIDTRYRRFERVPRPVSEAVMFCLMDVSGSMTEPMKYLAKYFYMLLYEFLTRRYRHVDIVFIRHTSTAEEVDEETFFYSRETGGTVVSTCLELMAKIARAKYSIDRWNIYGAQVSDGDNYGADSGRCIELLTGEILPMSQYFSYIEVGNGGLTGGGNDSDLWRSYDQVQAENFVMKRVGDPSHITPVFREIFAKGGAHAA